MCKATTSPPSAVERSSEVEKARVGSLDHVDGVQGASPVTEITAEVADTALEMSVGPLITELFPESRTETTVIEVLTCIEKYRISDFKNRSTRCSILPR